VSKKGLHGHYDRLTSEERFRLDVLATAREDSRESERLLSTCPRFSYVMNDRGFVGRWQGAIDITLRVYVPLGEQLAKLEMIDAFRVFVSYSQTLLSDIALHAYHKGHESGSRHAWVHAGESGAPSAWPEDGSDGEIVEPDGGNPAMEQDVDVLEGIAQQYNKLLPEVLDELERRCVKEAFGVWSGYAAFCEQSVGVSAEELAAVVLESLVDLIVDMRARAERLAVEADAGFVEHIRQGLEEAWRVVEARGA
jgi:hypothetical protein